MNRRLSITEARHAQRLRLMAVPGVPTPWSEAAKGLLYVKGPEYQSILQTADDDPELLQCWTGQTSSPELTLRG